MAVSGGQYESSRRRRNYWINLFKCLTKISADDNHWFEIVVYTKGQLD